MPKLNKYLTLIVLSISAFLINQKSVFADHAGAIEISINTYPIFLYITIALGVILIIVITRIIFLTKQIKEHKREGMSIQEKQDQRKFLFIFVIMLIIGFLSMGLIYFFLMSAATSQ